MPKKRDTQTYDLMDKGRIVYRGTTNDLERRRQEHKDEGKRFQQMVATSNKMTEEGAQRKEEKNLQTFRNSHSGKNPRYNKAPEG